eukprot:764716-Hanusia_phi.AAC.3
MLKRSQIDPPEIDESLQFQIVDWFVPEAASFEYSGQYDIEVYGVTMEGYTVRCSIEGFDPFFYVKCPENKTKKQLQAFIEDLETQFEQGSYRYYVKRDKKTIWKTAVPYNLWGHYKSMKIIKKFDFWGFQNGKTKYFIRVSVSSLKLFRVLRDVFATIKGFDLYESNIEPFIRFIHKHDILPCGWVKIDKNNILEHLSTGNCHYNISMNSEDINPIPKNTIAPLLIASFDIECTSSHGEFPMAIKDYRRVVQQIITMSQHIDINKHIKSILEKILVQCEDYVVDNTKIQRVFLKNPNSDSILNKIEKVENILHKFACDLSACEDDLTSLFNTNLPPISGDPIIQIGTTFHVFGSDEILYKHIVTLKDCSDIDGCDVVSCKDEKHVLLQWKKMIKDMDPDILTGYNILGFDFKYMHDRSIELGIDELFRTDLGRSSDRTVSFHNKTITSSALGEVITTFYDMEGVLIIDVFTFIKRDMNLESYKLDFVANHILKEHKNDLKPNEIFARFMGNADDIKIIAEYCIQDCCLVNKIIHKRKIIENNFGMANVCLVPVSYIFHRGQGIKIYSLVLNECSKRKQVIPTLQKDFEEEDEGYIGAIVLEPKTLLNEHSTPPCALRILLISLFY